MSAIYVHSSMFTRRRFQYYWLLSVHILYVFIPNASPKVVSWLRFSSLIRNTIKTQLSTYINYTWLEFNLSTWQITHVRQYPTMEIFRSFSERRRSVLKSSNARAFHDSQRSPTGSDSGQVRSKSAHLNHPPSASSESSVICSGVLLPWRLGRGAYVKQPTIRSRSMGRVIAPDIQIADAASCNRSNDRLWLHCVRRSLNWLYACVSGLYYFIRRRSKALLNFSSTSRLKNTPYCQWQ